MSFFSNRRQSQPENQRIERPQISSAPVTMTQQPIGFESVLGVHSKMEGYLESHANIRLDGEFSGTLKITGNVLVGERATINADINAKNISIAGAVKGNVSGNKVQLLRTARVWGDITATSFSTEEGAFIDGKISMSSAEPDVKEIAEVDTEDAQVSEIETGSSSPVSDDSDTAIMSRKEFNEQVAAEMASSAENEALETTELTETDEEAQSSDNDANNESNDTDVKD
ncbi:MAG: polymer-forming cytoskeletal protein [Aggregatilineales bacterium]